METQCPWCDLQAWKATWRHSVLGVIYRHGKQRGDTVSVLGVICRPEKQRDNCFQYGPGRAVIGPRWPPLPVQMRQRQWRQTRVCSSKTSLDFFTHALPLPQRCLDLYPLPRTHPPSSPFPPYSLSSSNDPVLFTSR